MEIPWVDKTHKIGKSQIIQNNKQRKMLDMKYNRNVDSCQVLENFKNHQCKIFFVYKPLETNKPIFIHFAVHICY